MRSTGAILLATFIAAACSGATATPSAPPVPAQAATLPPAATTVAVAVTPAPAATPPPAPTLAPAVTLPPAPTPVANGSTVIALGKVGHTAHTELVVLASQYATTGQYINPPAGDVWVAFKVKVTAEADDQTVSVSNFTAAADGTEQGQMGFADISDWQPALTIATINAGRSVTGWLVFEVPTPKKFVELDYTSSILGGAPELVFEESCCSE
ncbi:MAG: DUF4352 domain-containing protein [Candidatus Limnocylindrales bacterium]